MRRGRRAILLALFAACATGCRDDAPPDERRAQGFIGFVGASDNDPVWRVLEAEARRYVSGMGGYALKTAAPDDRSPTAQIAVIREMQSVQMRGLCIQPADTAIMKDILLDLRAQGIVVVTMMTPIDADIPFPHAGLDEVAVGQSMADAVHQAVGNGGTIAVIHDGGATRRLADRYLGFRDRIGRLPGVIVQRDMNCEDNPIIAARQMREYTERFPRLSGWVALDNWPLRDVGIETHILPPTCKLVTYGPFPQYWPRLTDGTCYAIIGVEYPRIARNALRMCATMAQGQVLPTKVYLAPPVMWTAQNFTAFKVAWLRALATPEPAPDSAPP